MSSLVDAMYYVTDAIINLTAYKNSLSIGLEYTACTSILSILAGLSRSSFRTTSRASTLTSINTIRTVHHPVIATDTAFNNSNFGNYFENFKDIAGHLLF